MKRARPPARLYGSINSRSGVAAQLGTAQLQFESPSGIRSESKLPLQILVNPEVLEDGGAASGAELGFPVVAL